MGATSAGAATTDPSRKAFPDSIRQVPATASALHQAFITRTVLTAAETAAVMPFEVGLRMRNFDELQARIAKGEVISDAEKAQRYFPLAADHEQVVAWLQSQGLEVTRTDANHLGIFGRGSVDAVAKAFQATFARVTAAAGGEYTSAITAPSLPADLAAKVLAVHGLQPHIRRHPLSARPAARTPGNGPIVNVTGYTPAQIATAYGASTLPSSVTGAGQTIAIYALAFPASTDLTGFWSAVASPAVIGNVTDISIAGGPGSSPSNDTLEEVTLDVEWASALAPGAAIRVYGANESDPAENDEILQQVYDDLPNNPNMHILSISIGGNELDVPKDYLELEGQYMANLASSGVTVLVASGDTGATANGVVQTSYPTSDPDVTGVGGTTLTLTPTTNTINTETAWNGSGGGISVVFARPSWQVGTGIGTGQATGTMRLTPDVAAAADPNYGALYYYQGGEASVGGTSWATPTWAGFVALLNQSKGTTLGFLNPKLYPLMGTVTHDITTGSNGAYSCTPGYDLVTGIGSPNIAALAAATLSATATAPSIPGTTGNRFTTVGQQATFFVIGNGAAPLTYQWVRQANGTSGYSALSNSTTYGGTTTNTLVVSNAAVGMTGDSFECVVTNGTGTATSAAATLTVGNVGVSTIAGWPGGSGHADGTGSAARFGEPGAVRTDSAGNIYVGDTTNYTIRKITPSGVVTTVAGIAGTSGSIDGPVATATFNAIGGVAVGPDGTLYVADSGNYTIRAISTSGIVSTLAGVAGSSGDNDGTGAVARLKDPQNLAIDSEGNIYVADGMGNVVRKIVAATGVVTTFAGNGAAGSANGTGITAQFNDPTGITVDPAGNIYVADYGNDLIRKITPAGVTSTLAGRSGVTGSAGGTGTAATFDGPAGVGADGFGNVYVADLGNNTIRKVDPTGFVTTVAGLAGSSEGTDGLSGNARFDGPGDVCVSASGIVYVADSLNSTIRRIIPGLDSMPSFDPEPANQSVNVGAWVAITAGVEGTAPFTYQWYENGTAIPGATGPSYVIQNAQVSNSGAYSVEVTNLDGSAASSAATLTVSVPTGDPDISAQPVGGSLSNGTLTLSVTVSGTGPFTYQWYLNGTAIAGATASTYTATADGSYTVAVTNSAATVTSSTAVVSQQSRLINISSRAQVLTGSGVTIAGFSISGPSGSTKEVLIRGIGPSLANFSISGYLTNPTLTLFNSSNTQIDTNTVWGTNPIGAQQIATISANVGAFALNVGTLDSVLVENLAPGNYSVELSGVDSGTGVGLIEVYEVNTADASQLVNISTRAAVGTGANILIAGFVIQGTQPMNVLVRAVGPGLAAFGVTGVLANPVLSVLDSNSNVKGTNTGWQTSADPSAITTAGSSVGAFALETTNADSAVVLTLPPGSYTAEVSGVDGTSGVALVEVYQLP
jgi:hypothetical protein